jgi:hypothetical protein
LPALGEGLRGDGAIEEADAIGEQFGAGRFSAQTGLHLRGEGAPSLMGFSCWLKKETGMVRKMTSDVEGDSGSTDQTRRKDFLFCEDDSRVPGPVIFVPLFSTCSKSLFLENPIEEQFVIGD